MLLIAIHLGIIEIIVFSFSCLLLAGTIYFFRQTLISLRSIKEHQKRMASRMVSTFNQETETKKVSKPFTFSFFQKRKSAGKASADLHFMAPVKRSPDINTETLHSVKHSILIQQQQLEKLMQKVDLFQKEGAPAVKNSNADLLNKIERLELELEEKEEALQSREQNNEVAEMMASRLEQVQREFNAMQDRLNGLEAQAATANQLAMDLDDVRTEYSQLQKEQQRKGEKLQETLNENARLHQQLCETEDKLQEANSQRQQLMKRARLLEELNTDFQSVSDTNFKMKNELRRIGELESMLNMMTEERDHLLSRRRVH